MDNWNKTHVNVAPLGSLGIILFVVFLVLKLMHVIDWSWWWITSPLWIEYTCVLPLILLVLAIVVFGTKKYNNDY